MKLWHEVEIEINQNYEIKNGSSQNRLNHHNWESKNYDSCNYAIVKIEIKKFKLTKLNRV